MCVCCERCLVASKSAVRDFAMYRYMWQIDLDSCRERHQVVAALKRLESSVAGQLGVGLIFSEEHLALEDRYRQCLESLASCAAAQGPILRPLASDVAIRIVGEF